MTAPVRYQYLISRSGDILFSFTVGTLAYFTNERDNPRAQNGKTLFELVKRRNQRIVERRDHQNADVAEN
ncbi:hypothetical protein BDB00DRAFT_799794 [Zychaea mexicana]|uniref:uncharacterized protein n=1 Tax=Zychaea mexicana TaxID=64656 RepID=UPI0022FDBC81|nr:uncharacterized protein BDB00DRAFT_799794 [Zychaea mexicana]KAI9498313.1 hypothetical protein BDB00DRAFT_799794 [Zychaea mexicana]